jgi:hypothetical protein
MDISLISSTFHSQEKLFCQTFLRNGFGFTRESASPTQPQPELSQPQPQLTDRTTSYTIFFSQPICRIMHLGPAEHFPGGNASTKMDSHRWESP